MSNIKGCKLSESHKLALKKSWEHRDRVATGAHWRSLNKSRTNIPLSKKHRDAIARGNTGKTMSAAACEKVRQSRLGKCIPHREATKRKISKTLKGRPRPPETVEKIRQATLLQHQFKHGPFKNTDIELALQVELYRRGIKFQSSKLLEGFIVDIFLPDSGIVIEADGCYWHGCPRCKLKLPSDRVASARRKDRTRTRVLRKAGYKVFRFWGHAINKSATACIDKLVL